MRASDAPEVRGICLQRQSRPASLFGWWIFILVAVAALMTGFPEAASPTTTDERRLKSASEAGKPDFTLVDLNGAQLELKQHAGRVVIVHFFATWCEPCREELSSLSQLIDRPRTEPLSVLAVNVAEVPVRVRRFIESAPVKFPVLLDVDRAVTKAWGVSILPTTFVLDRTLAARFFIEGDIDWTRGDVLAALEQLSTENAK